MKTVVPPFSLLQETDPSDWRDSFYYHYYEGAEGGHNVDEHYGVTTGRHKLIHYYKLDQWELFDLQADPHEMRSFYHLPAYADVRRELESKLDRLRNKLHVVNNDISAAETHTLPVSRPAQRSLTLPHVYSQTP
jgi:hypothetical protein